MRKTTGRSVTQSRDSMVLRASLSWPKGQVWRRKTISTKSASGWLGLTGEWVPEMPMPAAARAVAISAITPGRSVTGKRT